MKLKTISLITSILLLSACTPEQVMYFYQGSQDEQQSVIEHIIVEAADEFGVDRNLMLNIAKCESGFNPAAKNRKSDASGLYQYLASTWRSNSSRLMDREKDTVPYVLEDRFDPRKSARVTASIISEGGLFNWNESRHCWGR